MPQSQDFQPTRGTVLATFTQTGTYSGMIYVGGGRIVGLYSSNFPSAAGSVVFRSSELPTGTGFPVFSADGTALKLQAFGSGTFYTLGAPPFITDALQYVNLQIGTAGTAGVAAGGTMVITTAAR